MRLHTGSKPFKCPYCDLRFRTSGHRKTHIQFHFRASSERHKSKRFSSSACQSSQGEPGQAVTGGQGQSPAAPDALQPVGLLQTSSSDPNIYLPTNQVLTGQFDQNLLQPGLVGQTILPASMSGRSIIMAQVPHSDPLQFSGHLQQVVGCEMKSHIHILSPAGLRAFCFCSISHHHSPSPLSRLKAFLREIASKLQK